MVNFVHFPPRCVHLVESVPTCSGQERYLDSNNDYSSIMKNNQKAWWISRGTAEKTRNTTPCGFAPVTKADTMLVESLGPFLCPLLTIILLYIFVLSLVHFYYFVMHIWSLSWCMDQDSWNSWNLLSFIGLETSHRRRLEKRSLIDLVSVFIDAVATGLNFLNLWGEERALRLRTVTTGQWFSHYICLVKPQYKSMNMGIQRDFRVATHSGDLRALCSLGRRDSPHLHFHFALHISLTLLCLDLSFIIMWDLYLIGLPEYGHQIYWVIEHGVG